MKRIVLAGADEIAAFEEADKKRFPSPAVLWGVGERGQSALFMEST